MLPPTTLIFLFSTVHLTLATLVDYPICDGLRVASPPETLPAALADCPAAADHLAATIPADASPGTPLTYRSADLFPPDSDVPSAQTLPQEYTSGRCRFILDFFGPLAPRSANAPGPGVAKADPRQLAATALALAQRCIGERHQPRGELRGLGDTNLRLRMEVFKADIEALDENMRYTVVAATSTNVEAGESGSESGEGTGEGGEGPGPEWGGNWNWLMLVRAKRWWTWQLRYP